MVSGDISPPVDANAKGVTFVQTDVASWPQLTALFKKTKEIHGRVDHVFANAGLGPRTDYLAMDVDENGDLKEPSTDVLDVSLKGVMNTVTLAMFYMRQQSQPQGGSIVVNGSAMGIQRCRAVDYGKTKGAQVSMLRVLLTLIQLPPNTPCSVSPVVFIQFSMPTSCQSVSTRSPRLGQKLVSFLV